MKKKHPIVMLPTEKTGTIQRNKSDKLWISKVSTGKSSTILERPVVIGGTYDSAQHLYILSDEEIKVGDWTIDIECNLPHGRLTTIDNDIELKEYASQPQIKKVIATTDKSLFTIESGKPFADRDIQVMLPWIPESFLPIFVKAYNEGNPITEVELEYYSPEFFPHVKSDIKVIPRLKTTESNEVIISLLEERMYTKERFIEELHNYWDSTHGVGHHNPNIIKWIKENL